MSSDPGEQVEVIRSTMNVPVLLDRGSLAALTELLDLYQALGYEDPGTQHVSNGYGMQGVQVQFEIDGADCEDLWWFADESHDYLVPGSRESLTRVKEFLYRDNEAVT